MPLSKYLLSGNKTFITSVSVIGEFIRQDINLYIDLHSSEVIYTNAINYNKAFNSIICASTQCYTRINGPLCLTSIF